MTKNKQSILSVFNEKEFTQFGSFALEVAQELNSVFTSALEKKCKENPELPESKIIETLEVVIEDMRQSPDFFMEDEALLSKLRNKLV